MNVGLPSETIKNAAIRIKELELENESKMNFFVLELEIMTNTAVGRFGSRVIGWDF
jgi:hypothetical protein